MLLGCCHCGETPSDSTPSGSASSNPSSEGASSGNEISLFGNVCGWCSVFPRRFNAPITNAMFTFDSRGGTRTNCAEFSPVDIVYTGTTRSVPMAATPGTSGPCAVWQSVERAKNTNVAASCADHTVSTPIIEMIAQSGGTSVTLTLAAWHWGGSVFGSPTYFGTLWRYTYNPPASGSNCATDFTLSFLENRGTNPTYTSSIILAPSVLITPS
jgi:hypothetical protein